MRAGGPWQTLRVRTATPAAERSGRWEGNGWQDRICSLRPVLCHHLCLRSDRLRLGLHLAFWLSCILQCFLCSFRLWVLSLHLLGGCMWSRWSRTDRGTGAKDSLLWFNRCVVPELVCKGCDRRQAVGGFCRGHQRQCKSRYSPRFRLDSSLCWFLLVRLWDRGRFVGLFWSLFDLSFPPFLLLSSLLYLLITFTVLLLVWIVPLLARGGGRSAASWSATILVAFPLLNIFRLFRYYSTQEALCCCPCQDILDCFHLRGIRLKKQGQFWCEDTTH